VRRLTPFAGLLVVALVALTAPAAAGASLASTTTTAVEEAAAAFRGGEGVFVDPTAERALDPVEADELRDAVSGAGTAIFVAVLPASAAGPGGVDAVPRELAEATGFAGTYAVVVGDSFRAGSSLLPQGTAGELATRAFQAHRDEGTAAVLLDYVDRVDAAASGQAPTGGQPNGGTARDGDDGTGFGAVLLLGGAGLGGWALWRSSRRRRAAAEASARRDAADRQMLRAELSVLADDVMRLEPEVALHEEARSDFDAAVHRYRAAEAALDYADEPVDLVRVERVVLEARYAMDRARARVDGREPPPPPEELRRRGRHGEPPIELDDRREPVYVGYPGSFGTGWYGLGGGLFTGLLLGQVLGGWGHGWHGWGGGWGQGGGNDDAGWGGGFGGGDFGGGFGGGDFGGGGGGDW